MEAGAARIARALSKVLKLSNADGGSARYRSSRKEW
jgi:hypothetical protein